jgi:hypothetical protein
MTMKMNAWAASALGLSLVLSGAGMAQTAAPPSQVPAVRPAIKPIGTPTAHQQVVPSLIVLNAKGASLTADSLVLTGVAPSSIIFADRPVRSAGHALTAHLIDTWTEGKDSFAKDPPNATVSVFDKDAKTVKDAVVTLKSPKLEGDKLTFAIDVLEGDLTGADGAASVFIDIIGLPFTPMSFAGVARRTAYRGAFYAGAASAAAGAYPYYRPYPPPYYPPPYYPPYYRPY